MDCSSLCRPVSGRGHSSENLQSENLQSENLQHEKLDKFREQLIGACEVLQEVDAAPDSMHLSVRYQKELIKLKLARRQHKVDVPRLEGRADAMEELLHHPDLLKALLSRYQSVLEQLVRNSDAVSSFDLRSIATKVGGLYRAEPAVHGKPADAANAKRSNSADFADWLLGGPYDVADETSFGYVDLISGRLQQQALADAALRHF